MQNEFSIDLKKRIDQLNHELIDLRRDFHMYPELGFEEFRSAKVVEAYLQNLGLKTTRVAGTGVVSMLDGGQPGPVLMLRADMDGLPIVEANEFDYKSRNHGIMHACGHDAHMAILLIATKILIENRENLHGSVKIVFQPNEETAGAYKMIEEGVLEGPQVDAVLGLHVWSPLESGKIGISAGTVMGGLDVFKIEISGQGGHTALPHQTVDPVLASAAIIQGVQAIQTREIDTLKPTSIVFGKIQGGSTANVIPDRVELQGTIRYLHEPGLDNEAHPSEKFRKMVLAICEIYRCKCEVTIEKENIPLTNDNKLAQLTQATAQQVFEESNRIVDVRTMASEDFSEFSTKVPGVYMFLGASTEEGGSGIPHHTPHFDIEEKVLCKGVEMFVRSVFSVFQNAEILGIQTNT